MRADDVVANLIRSCGTPAVYAFECRQDYQSDPDVAFCDRSCAGSVFEQHGEGTADLGPYGHAILSQLSRPVAGYHHASTAGSPFNCACGLTTATSPVLGVDLVGLVPRVMRNVRVGSPSPLLIPHIWSCERKGWALTTSVPH